jgi:hypothetical protein
MPDLLKRTTPGRVLRRSAWSAALSTAVTRRLQKMLQAICCSHQQELDDVAMQGAERAGP